MSDSCSDPGALLRGSIGHRQTRPLVLLLLSGAEAVRVTGLETSIQLGFVQQRYCYGYVDQEVLVWDLSSNSSRSPISQAGAVGFPLQSCPDPGSRAPAQIMECFCCFSIAIAWLYGHTQGSLLLAMLMHSAFNQTIGIVFRRTAASQKPFALGASLPFLLTIAWMWPQLPSSLFTCPISGASNHCGPRGYKGHAPGALFVRFRRAVRAKLTVCRYTSSATLRHTTSEAKTWSLSPRRFR